MSLWTARVLCCDDGVYAAHTLSVSNDNNGWKVVCVDHPGQVFSEDDVPDRLPVGRDCATHALAGLAAFDSLRADPGVLLEVMSADENWSDPHRLTITSDTAETAERLAVLEGSTWQWWAVTRWSDLPVWAAFGFAAPGNVGAWIRRTGPYSVYSQDYTPWTTPAAATKAWRALGVNAHTDPDIVDRWLQRGVNASNVSLVVDAGITRLQDLPPAFCYPLPTDYALMLARFGRSEDDAAVLGVSASCYAEWLHVCDEDPSILERLTDAGISEISRLSGLRYVIGEPGRLTATRGLVQPSAAPAHA